MSYRSLAQGRDVLDTKIKWTIVGLAFLTVIVLGVLMVHRAAFSTELNSDFTTYRAAGWAVLIGSDIYKVQNPRGWPYVYPPPFAIMMTPFAKMNAFTASVIWYLLSVILVVSSVQMSVTMVRGSLVRAVWPGPILVVRAAICNGVVMGRARSSGRAGVHLDVMVIDVRAVSVPAREGHFRRRSVGMCRVAEGFPVGVASPFHPRKALAVGDGNDDSADRWRDCVASAGLWLAAKSNLLAGVDCGCCPAVSGKQNARPTKGSHQPGSQSRQPAKSSPSGGIVAVRGGTPRALPDGSYWFDDGVGDVGGGPTNATAARCSHRRRVVSVAPCYRPGFAFPLSYVGAVAHDRVGVFGAGQY